MNIQIVLLISLKITSTYFIQK